MLLNQTLNAILANNSTVGISSVIEQVGLISGGDTANITGGAVNITSTSGDITMESPNGVIYTGPSINLSGGGILLESRDGAIIIESEFNAIYMGPPNFGISGGIDLISYDSINLITTSGGPYPIPNMVVTGSHVINNTMPILKTVTTSLVDTNNITLSGVISGLITTNTTSGTVALTLDDTLDSNWGVTLSGFNGAISSGSTFPFLVVNTGSHNTTISGTGHISNNGVISLSGNTSRMTYLQYNGSGNYIVY